MSGHTICFMAKWGFQVLHAYLLCHTRSVFESITVGRQIVQWTFLICGFRFGTMQGFGTARVLTPHLKDLKGLPDISRHGVATCGGLWMIACGLPNAIRRWLDASRRSLRPFLWILLSADIGSLQTRNCIWEDISLSLSYLSQLQKHSVSDKL